MRKRSIPSGFASQKSRAQGKCPDCIDRPAGTATDHVHVQCPACLDRGALNVDGRVRTEGGELRGATRSAGRRKLSGGCEGCKGTGNVPNYDTRDPYQINGWLVRDAAPATPEKS